MEIGEEDVFLHGG